MPIEVEAREGTSGAFRLGDWLVEPSLNRVSKGETSTQLELKVMDVLLCLAERAGEVVTRQEIIDRVWATEYIADNTLTHAIAEIRNALQDDARQPRYIETIPRRGYRLVAEGSPVDVERSDEDPAPEGPRSKLRPAAWVAALGLLGLILGYALVSWRQSPPGAPAVDSDPHRIAVVPFENLTSGSDHDGVARHATETILHGLTDLEEVDVVPAAKVVDAIADAYAIDAFEIGSATRAGLVLTGVIARSDEGLELQATLEDTINHKIVRAFDPIPASPENTDQAISTLRDWTLIEVQDFLHPLLAFGRGDRIPKIEAYREYRTYFEISSVNEYQAPLHFSRALELDPELYRARLWVGAGPTDPTIVESIRTSAIQRFEPVLAHRDRLTASQQQLVDAITARIDGNWERALRIFRDVHARHGDFVTLSWIVSNALHANRPLEAIDSYRGIVWDPITPTQARFIAGGWAATALHRLGRHQEELKLARSLSASEPIDAAGGWPERHEMYALAAFGSIDELRKMWASERFFKQPRHDATHRNAAVMAVLAGELRAHGFFGPAEDMAGRGLEWIQSSGLVDPEDPESRWWSAILMGRAGRPEEALEVLRRLHRDQPEDPAIWAELGAVAAAVGDRDTAYEMSAQLAEVGGHRALGIHVYGRARIAARLGDREAALDLLRKAIGEGFCYYERLHRSSDFDALRDDPEFQEVVRPKG